MSIAFRQAVENRDVEALEASLHPDVVFSSPAVFAPYEGRETVMGVLRHVVHVLADLKYTDELAGDGTHGLVFLATVDGKTIQGWDYLKVDADGLVTELTVMMRPLSGLIAVGQAMGERTAKESAGK
jgi:hypothetical protein